MGAGQFSPAFLPLFAARPDVAEVSLCEIDAGRRTSAAARFGVARTFATFGEALSSNVDAIGLFTPRWTHAPLAIKAMESGKHVYRAVPAALSLEELEQLILAVRSTGMTSCWGRQAFVTEAAFIAGNAGMPRGSTPPGLSRTNRPEEAAKHSRSPTSRPLDPGDAPAGSGHRTRNNE